MDAGTRAAPGPGEDLRSLALAFSLGVLAVHGLAQLPTAWILIALGASALAPWRHRAPWAAFVLGVLWTAWRAQGLLDQRWPETRYNEEVVVTGAVASLPERGGPATRFLFETDAPGVPPRIRAAWYRNDAFVAAGECWRLTLRLRPPHGSMNPGEFDYEGWLFRQGIGAAATVRSGEPCGFAAGYGILRFRAETSRRLREWLPGHPARAVVAAATVGDDTDLSDEDWDLFRKSGTSHLIAISGFNIAIVAGCAFFLLRWAWSALPRLSLWLPAQRVALLGSAVFGAAYALIAGFEVSTRRAVVMLLVAVIAAWLGRASQPSRVLACAWLAVLVFDPFAVMSPGFWLSFGAVAAIFFLLGSRLRAPAPWRGFLWLQLGLSLCMLPLTLFFFQGAAWTAPLVNLIAVPLFAVMTPALLVALLAAWTWPWAGAPLLWLCAEVLRGFQAVLAWTLAHAPEAWTPASPPAAALVMALIGVLLLCAPRGLPLRALGLLCLVPALMPPSLAPAAGFDVAALDVGQGLAVVVRTSRHTLLFDTGPAFEDAFDAGASVVAPYLFERRVPALDLMVVSHTDLDHRGGAPAVRRRLPVLGEMGALTGEPCVAGRRWEWDGVAFEVLNGPADAPAPAGRGKAHPANNGGCVLRVQAGAHALLLPADIEAAVERRLLHDDADKLRADVLVAPHHGSKTSSTEEFVRAVHPAVVIYSAGWHNRFRHPRPEVTARYAAIGADAYMTGDDGAVTLRIDAQAGVTGLSTWRPRATRFWNAPAAGKKIPDGEGA
jgi:competence protein ComEC